MELSNPGAVIENTIRMRMLKDFFSKHGKSGTLLDLGCGARPYYDCYAPYFEKTIGADLADSPFPKKQIDIYCFATSVPLPDESVDVILCTEVLQDIAEPTDLIIEALRLLKPGGTLLLTCPFLVPIADGKYDNYRFTRYGLNYQLEKGGFIVKEIIPEADTIAASTTLAVKPVLRFWNLISKILHVKAIYKWYNPLLFLTVILPQVLYLLTAPLPIFKTIYRKFNYGPIGYITISEKPKK